MIPLYTEREFKSSKYRELLPLRCQCCNTTFYKSKSNIVYFAIQAKSKNALGYCSAKCYQSTRKPKIDVICLKCQKPFKKRPDKVAKNPNHFCSKTCSAQYNAEIKKNISKRSGSTRSKLETYVEQNLIQQYPNLDLVFNSRQILNGLELDIYIKSLNLAIEINGVLHYEPIYGTDKLKLVQNSDRSKSKMCHDLKIDLCIINTSDHRYVSDKTCKKYLDIITEVINTRTQI